MTRLRSRVQALRALRRFLSRESFDTSTAEGRSEERYRRATLTGVASGAARLVSMAALLISVPVALGYLGAERYGVVVTISALTAMLVFADFGLGNGLMNLVARASGEEDPTTAVRAISSAFVMLVVVAIALTIAFIPIYFAVPWADFMNVTDPVAVAEAGPAVAVLFGSVVLNLPLTLAHRVQLAYQRGFMNAFWNAAASVVALGGLVVAVRLRAGLPVIVLTTIGAPLLANALNWVSLFARQRPDLRPHWARGRVREARALLRVGFLFFVLQLTVAVAYQSDVLVATRLLGPEAATTYSVVYRLFMVLPALVNMLLLPLWPAYTEAIARGDTEWISRTLRRSVGVSLALTGTSSALLLLAAPAVLAAWVGPGVVAPFGLLLGMAIWAVVSNSFNAVALLLNGASVMGFQVVTALTMAIVSVGGSIVLASVFGVSGVIWGTLLAYVACSAIPITLYLPRLLRELPARAARRATLSEGAPA